MSCNPFDRVRSTSSQAIESGEDCYSVVVTGEDGSHLILPYSHLRGATAEDGMCVLMHSLGVVTITGPREVIEETIRLLSRQRSATVRHGLEKVSVEIGLLAENNT
jgi:hypothetical protein